MSPCEGCPTLLQHPASADARAPREGKNVDEVLRAGFIKARRTTAASRELATERCHGDGNAEMGRKVQRMAHMALLVIMGFTTGAMLVVGLFLAGDTQGAPVDAAGHAGVSLNSAHSIRLNTSGSGELLGEGSH